MSPPFRVHRGACPQRREWSRCTRRYVIAQPVSSAPSHSATDGVENQQLARDIHHSSNYGARHTVSSLGTVAGNYLDPETNAIVNLNSDGTIFSQDAVTGCVINGEVSTIDSAYNAYRMEYEFSGCQGDAAVLNGTMARGLATLDDTVSPERAVIGVVNAAAGYSLVGRYPRT